METKSYLLDTHCLIWYQENNAKLSPSAKDVILNPDNIIFFSQVILYKIVIKESIGKMPYFKSNIGEVYRQVIQDNFTFLQIHNDHLETYHKVPFFDNHRDPFDRLLIAMAIKEKATIITIDTKFHLYSDIIEIIW